MVRPGATIRKPRVNVLLLGRRTALMVCQASSMAMTVVLPAPVASFSANRMNSGLASWLALAKCSRKALPLPVFGATSVSQMAVSTASTHLAEERTDVAELVLPPMLQQAGGFGGDLPLIGMWETTPLIDLLPY